MTFPYYNCTFFGFFSALCDVVTTAAAGGVKNV